MCICLSAGGTYLTYLGQGVATLDGRVSTLDWGNYPGQGVPTFDGSNLPLGVPILGGCTYLGWCYLPWMGNNYPGQGVPTLVGGYLPSIQSRVTTLDRGYLPLTVVPTLDRRVPTLGEPCQMLS